MHIEFTSPGTDNAFVLGRISFNWLDGHDVFDKYQEDDDYYSECIFHTSVENVNQLAIDISCVACQDSSLREDMKEKLIAFSEFVKSSNGLSAIIL
jgi:hypothetical protein